MQSIVNILGTLTVALCAVLLLRAYLKVRQRLLLWSGLCFAGLTLSNLMIFVDMFLTPPEMSLYSARLGIAASSMLVLVYGLIFESD